jgi:hypothetical protein
MVLQSDGEQLEAGDALDDNCRGMAADEIERFRREIIERTGGARAVDDLTDRELLREVINTVGKHSQLKRITKQWIDTCLVCKGDTKPALLMYQELADMVCNKITAAITCKRWWTLTSVATAARRSARRTSRTAARTSAAQAG